MNQNLTHFYWSYSKLTFYSKMFTKKKQKVGGKATLSLKTQTGINKLQFPLSCLYLQWTLFWYHHHYVHNEGCIVYFHKCVCEFSSCGQAACFMRWQIKQRDFAAVSKKGQWLCHKTRTWRRWLRPHWAVSRNGQAMFREP